VLVWFNLYVYFFLPLMLFQCHKTRGFFLIMVDLLSLEISFLPNSPGKTIWMGRKCKNLHFSVFWTVVILAVYLNWNIYVYWELNIWVYWDFNIIYWGGNYFTFIKNEIASFCLDCSNSLYCSIQIIVEIFWWFGTIIVVCFGT
jgi:hypothetical protein